MRHDEQHLVDVVRIAVWTVSMTLLMLILFVLVLSGIVQPTKEKQLATEREKKWVAPDTNALLRSSEGNLILYGRELIIHTARYLGPEGSVAPMTNGMNCQNCHLEAGTKPWGNNFSAVASMYPKYRERSGNIETISKRVNDCMERSLNGKALSPSSHEMTAIVAYLQWVGGEVPRGTAPPGVGIADVPLLDRAADPVRGATVFALQCARCHGPDGGGTKAPVGPGWIYPPLWGDASFNNGAGLLRLSRLAGFIFANMPNDAGARVLTPEEAWDVAAYISSMPRPSRDLSGRTRRKSLSIIRLVRTPMRSRSHSIGMVPSDL
jgi:thiosulfate dehydrogenase